MTRHTARSPLAHPLWLTALALLVLNDHWFKHEPALAGAVTGKLSDFAGLVVAPPVLAVLLRARGSLARGACIALVGAGFVAIKLVPPCASLAEQSLAALGVPSRIWVDPTDLIALPALWLADRVLRHEEPASRWFARAALVTGLLACVATSDRGAPRESAILINHRNAPLEVEIAAGPELDCDTYDLASLRALPRSYFTDARGWTMEPQSWAHLDGGACGVVWLKIEGAFDGVIAWSDLSHRPDTDDLISKALLPIAVTVEGLRDELRITVGEELESLPSPPENE